MSSLYQNILLEQQRLTDFTNVASDWLWETDATQRLTFLLGSDAVRADYFYHTFSQIKRRSSITPLHITVNKNGCL